jgi:hypothetical protein
MYFILNPIKKNSENIEFLVNINFTREIIINDKVMIIEFNDAVKIDNIFSKKFYIAVDNKIYIKFSENIEYIKKILESLAEIVDKEWDKFAEAIIKYGFYYKVHESNKVRIIFDGNDHSLSEKIYKYYIYCSKSQKQDRFYIEIYWQNDNNLKEIKYVIHVLEIVFLNYDKIVKFIEDEIKRIIKENRDKFQEFFEKIKSF